MSYSLLENYKSIFFASRKSIPIITMQTVFTFVKSIYGDEIGFAICTEKIAAYTTEFLFIAYIISVTAFTQFQKIRYISQNIFVNHSIV